MFYLNNFLLLKNFESNMKLKDMVWYIWFICIMILFIYFSWSPCIIERKFLKTEIISDWKVAGDLKFWEKLSWIAPTISEENYSLAHLLSAVVTKLHEEGKNSISSVYKAPLATTTTQSRTPRSTMISSSANTAPFAPSNVRCNVNSIEMDWHNIFSCLLQIQSTVWKGVNAVNI